MDADAAEYRDVDADADPDDEADAAGDPDMDAFAEPDGDGGTEIEITSKSLGAGYWPRLLADTGGRVHLVYHGGDQLFYRRFASGAWSAAENVPGSGRAAWKTKRFRRHQVAIQPDGERVYVSWGSGRNLEPAILFAMKDASGWNGPETACGSDDPDVDPSDNWEYTAVAVQSSGDVYVFCMFGDVYAARRSPSGSWDEPVRIVSFGGSSKHIVAAVDSTDEMHLSFRLTTVHYFHGDGATWSGLYEAVSLPEPGCVERPILLTDGSDGLHMTWQRWTSEGDWNPVDIRYASGYEDVWTAGGEGVVVHEASDVFNPPEMALSASGGILVSWVEGQSVFLSISTDSGSTFGTPIEAAGDAAPVDPDVTTDLASPPGAVIDETAHIVYENADGDLTHLVIENLPW